MGIFGNKDKTQSSKELIKSIDEITNEDKDQYNDTLNYLVTLSDDDYDKMLKCAKIYRDADKKVSEVMGKATPADGEQIEVRVEKSDSSDDFIETDASKKGKKTSVKKD